VHFVGSYYIDKYIQNTTSTDNTALSEIYTSLRNKQEDYLNCILC